MNTVEYSCTLLELEIASVNIPETKQLSLKVINNVDSWDLQNGERSCKILL